MTGMGRRLPLYLLVALVALVALLAAEPLFHQHPLDASANTPVGVCVACAAGVTRLAVFTPAVAAPLVVVYSLTAIVVLFVAATLTVAIPSRAPPAL